MKSNVIDRVVIHTETGKKGRSFEVSLLGYVRLGSSGSRDTIRPEWMVYAETEDTVRPFTANLMMGNKITVAQRNPGRLYSSTTLEVLRSSGSRYAPQKLVDGFVAMTVFNPRMFQLNPGMVDPVGIEFLLAPPADWLRDHASKFPNAAEIGAYVSGLRMKDVPNRQFGSLMPLASLFCGYLDRRTRVPLIRDPRFQLQLLVQCLNQGAASFAVDTDTPHYDSVSWGVSRRSEVHNAKTLGLGAVVHFTASHEDFGTLVAEETARYFRATT